MWGKIDNTLYVSPNLGETNVISGYHYSFLKLAKLNTAKGMGNLYLWADLVGVQDYAAAY